MDPPATECRGFVHNSPDSDISIGAEMWSSETPSAVERGQAFMGTLAERVGGFSTSYGGVHLTIDYFQIGGGYLETHDLDVTAPRRFDVNPCHEAYVTATNLPAPDGGAVG